MQILCPFFYLVVKAKGFLFQSVASYSSLFHKYFEGFEVLTFPRPLKNVFLLALANKGILVLYFMTTGIGSYNLK